MLSECSDRIIYLGVLGPLVLAIGTRLAGGRRRFLGRGGLCAHARGRTKVCVPLSEALAAPIGDRAARLATERSPADIAAARDGFLRGGNSPEDIDGPIRLYRYFAWTPLLRPSIEAWRKGDDLIEQLRVIGERLCVEPVLDPNSPAALATHEELDQIDAALIELNKRFSASLERSETPRARYRVVRDQGSIEVASEPGRGARFAVRLRKA